MLKCERLKLLHSQLHGDQDSTTHHPAPLRQPLAVSRATPTSEVVEELAELNQAIALEKRRVLRVMRRLEEQSRQSSSE